MGSTGAEGRCHGNYFLAFDGWSCRREIASVMIFDTRGGFSGSSSPMKT